MSVSLGNDGDDMNSRLDAFYRSLRGKRICMLGIGRSNTPLIKIFLSKGAAVCACDKRSREQLGNVGKEIEAAGATLQLGDTYLDNLDFDILFRTPGIRYTLPELDTARANGVAVTSEMEVFFDVCPCKIIAVTGSDGKTTTTTLISEILKREGYRVHLGGNIGRPLLPEIENIREEDVAVVELSSFQLISMRRSPDIAVITNITPNHLDMHKDMEEYIQAKRNIFLHQNGFSRTVLNLDNDLTAPMVQEVRGQCFTFSRKQRVRFGCFCDTDGSIWMNDGKSLTKFLHKDDILIPGSHNIENYMTAAAAVWGMAKPETIVGVARSFTGVEHRIELVRNLDGVHYYNDSIATTPSRTIAGLHSFSQKVILIAGGYDKHIPFDVLGPVICQSVKHLILLGDTADKIAQVTKSASGYSAEELSISRVDSLEQAVQTAHACAKSGDVVLLSPACASFDMFKDFETRGDLFKNFVNSL